MNFNKGNYKICIVGLGYVGLPLAARFSLKKFNVVGFDIDKKRVKELSNNFDIICTCNKGSIEAIKHVKYNWLGWMWHPERGKKFNTKLLKIGKEFFTK